MPVGGKQEENHLDSCFATLGKLCDAEEVALPLWTSVSPSRWSSGPQVS